MPSGRSGKGYVNRLVKATSTAVPTFTALGGIQTCGHVDVARSQLFRSLVYRGLRSSGLVRTIQNSCLSGAGPLYPSCCLSYFVTTPATKYATLDYVSSIADKGDSLDIHLQHSAVRPPRVRPRPTASVTLATAVPSL